MQTPNFCPSFPQQRESTGQQPLFALLDSRCRGSDETTSDGVLHFSHKRKETN